jgi:hypothetical protein
MKRRYVIVAAALLAAAHAYGGITETAVNAGAPGFGLQPRNKALTVCFVGDALTSQAQNVSTISGIIHNHFEAAANIRFAGFNAATGTFPQCAAPKSGMCGTEACDQYPEDIRIALDGTAVNGAPVPRQIPVTDTHCVDRGAPSSWGVSPWNVDKPGYRACRYNVFIGSDSDTSVVPPRLWVNHTLHEVGHALGFVHEFLQADFFNFIGPNGSICTNSTNEPAALTSPGGFVSLTPADAASVMMYVDSSCDIHGNYAHTGLSGLDRLSLHIFYPEDARVAEYLGTTTIKVNQTLRLRSLLAARGARMDRVVSKLKWSIGGIVGTTPTFETSWSTPGTRSGTLEYDDFVGRHFSVPITVRVVTPADFARAAGASSAAQGPLL